LRYNAYKSYGVRTSYEISRFDGRQHAPAR